MAKQYIEIYSGETLQETRVSMTEYDVENNFTVIAYADGSADETTVMSGGAMIVSGGTATDTTILKTGVMTVNSGVVSDVTLHSQSTLNLNGAASQISSLTGGAINVNAGGIGSNVSLYSSASLVSVAAGGAIQGVVQRGGAITLAGGSADDVTTYDGTLSVGAGSVANNVELRVAGGSISVLSGGTLIGATCCGAEITVASGGVACNSIVTGYTEESPFSEEETFTGTMTLETGAVHKGTLTITRLGKVIAQTGAIIDFTISESTPGASALIDNLTGITGTPYYSLTVKSDQQNGTYALAGNASSFAEQIYVQNTDALMVGYLSLDNALVTHDYSYTLTLAEQTLSLTVADSPETPHDLAGSVNGIAWQSTANQFCVQYSQDDFASALALQTGSHGVDSYALSAGSYDWQVKSAEGSRWSEGNAIVSAYVPGTAEAWQSNGNGVGDLFFANASGTWTGKYAAQHVGVGDWSGTGEQVRLSGKNRISDTFTGSDDANILVLTDDANGDALFVDDVYSAFPAEQQSRIAKIQEIRAGAGDDVVDMTSQSFEYLKYQTKQMIVRGGDGNDTIWANKAGNMLFGDAGNDRIVGCQSEDVIAGGSGNDSMHGGGGSDVFCFCDAWGADTVEQLAAGSVTLWFTSGSEDNWDQSTMTYTDGDNTVKVTGVASVVLKFGDDGSEQYDALAAAGCFLQESSSRIFATQQNGVLATL